MPMTRATWLPEIIRGIRFDQGWGEVMTNDQFNDEIVAWKRSLPNFLCSHCRKAARLTVKDYAKWGNQKEAGIVITGDHVMGPLAASTGDPELLECKDPETVAAPKST